MNRQQRRAEAAHARAAGTAPTTKILDVPARAAQLERANEKLFGLMREYRGAIDAVQAERLPEANVSCRRGCSACCRQVVLAELREAEIIVARHPRTVARLLPVLNAHNRAISQALTDDDHRKFWEEGRDMTTSRVVDVYWNLNIPCAFLQDGACSIYEDRPNACRTHFVSSPAELCEGKEASQPVRLVDLGTRHGATKLHMMTLRDVDSPPTFGMLPQLIMVAAGATQHATMELANGVVKR